MRKKPKQENPGISIEQEAFALYTQGFDIDAIGVKLHKSKRTVYRYIESVQPKKEKKPKPPEKKVISSPGKISPEEKQNWTPQQWDTYFGTNMYSWTEGDVMHPWTEEQWDEYNGIPRKPIITSSNLFTYLKDHIDMLISDEESEHRDRFCGLYPEEVTLLQELPWDQFQDQWTQIGWILWYRLILAKYFRKLYWNPKWEEFDEDEFDKLSNYLDAKALQEKGLEYDPNHLNYDRKTEIEQWIARSQPQWIQIQSQIKAMGLSPEEVLSLLKKTNPSPQ